MKKLSIIIPAHNEEKRISNVINLYTSFLDEKYDYDIIIVCDGDDDTNKIVKTMSTTRDNIRLVEFSERQGKGRAIVEGFKIAHGEILAFIDADESISPFEFEKLLCNLHDNDCVIASRRIDGAHISVGQPILRRISSRTFNVIINLMFDLKIKDTQCGAKVFKRDVICSIISLMKTNGFEFDVELLWRLKNKGYKIKEVPIIWGHNGGSTFSLKYSHKMLISLVKIRLEDLINHT